LFICLYGFKNYWVKSDKIDDIMMVVFTR